MSKSSKRRTRNNQGNMVPANQPAPGIIPGAGVVVTTTQVTGYSGPIPPPEVLVQYDDVIPGAAERILKMAESQVAHRQELERRVVASDITKSYGGMFAAFTLAIASIVGGAVVANNGQPWAGGLIATAVVVSLASTFLYAGQARREERAERANAMVRQKR